MTSIVALVALAGCTPEVRLYPPASRDGGGTQAYDHVLIVSIDTLRADALGAYGGPSTPHLDALAEGGALFTAASTPAPTTLAAHTSMMTGTWPHTHGVPRNGFLVPDSQRMLAEILGDHGFYSAAFLGGFPLQSGFNFTQGFDHVDEHFDMVKEGWRGCLGPEIEQNQRTAGSLNDALFTWLDRGGPPADAPKFLFVHYFDPHAPYSPPEPFRPEVDAQGSLDDRRAVRDRWPAPEAADLSAELGALYAGEVAYTDHAIGELLAGLDRRSLLERTLVVVTSDHGESATEHDEIWDHGLGVWQETVHVPWILSGPEISPIRIDGPVSTVDLAPTVLDLLGISMPAAMEGRTLKAALGGVALQPRPAFSEATKPRGGPAEEGVQWANIRKCRAVRIEGYKRIRCPMDGTAALFDLDADPGETVEQTHALPDVAAKLDATLAAWDRDAAPPATTFDDDPETIRQLEALGYSE